MTHSFDIPNYMNFLKWSPFGSYFVLASLSAYGTVMFCHLNDQDKVEVGILLLLLLLLLPLVVFATFVSFASAVTVAAGGCFCGWW